jgi:hypothetical protein
MEEITNIYAILFGKSGERDFTGEPMPRCEKNVEMDLEYMDVRMWTKFVHHGKESRIGLV